MAAFTSAEAAILYLTLSIHPKINPNGQSSYTKPQRNLSTKPIVYTMIAHAVETRTIKSYKEN